MQKGRYLEALLKSGKSVLTSKDIMLLWRDANIHAVTVRINYYIKRGSLIKLRKGLYATHEEYNKLELATRILTPSYVSFETVLASEGVIFQYYESIFVASYVKREIQIDNQIYSFKRLPKKILLNPIGVEQADQMSTASRERAILDTLYINSDYYFDNLRSVDWDKINDILLIYNNKRMSRIIEKLRKNHDN